MDYRYHDTAHRFDDDLQDLLEDNAREAATEKAASEAEARSRASGGLERIEQGLTPYEQVQSILAAKKPDAEQIVREHAVRQELKKRAAAPQRRIIDFLQAVKG